MNDFRMRWGALAGAIGGALLAIIMLVVAIHSGRHVEALGIAIVFAVSVAWGVLFSVLAYGASRGMTMLLGPLFGALSWIAMFFVVMPLVGAGVIASSARGVTVLEHLAFGSIVAVAFALFVQGRPKRSAGIDRAWR
jgi:hypothetical protein